MRPTHSLVDASLLVVNGQLQVCRSAVEVAVGNLINIHTFGHGMGRVASFSAFEFGAQNYVSSTGHPSVEDKNRSFKLPSKILIDGSMSWT